MNRGLATSDAVARGAVPPAGEPTSESGSLTADERHGRLVLAERVVEKEWAQLGRVDNEGGRAACQDDLPTFHQMRLSQFLTWPADLLRSYTLDLEQAETVGRNLLTEKFARMMESTEPDRYAREIGPWLPVLDPGRVREQERAVATQVAWADDFRRRYPRLGLAMRALRTAEDTLVATSFETYLRGELGTYSHRTLEQYVRLVGDTSAAGGNLTEQTVRWTVLLAGYGDLAEAEGAQAG